MARNGVYITVDRRSLRSFSKQVTALANVVSEDMANAENKMGTNKVRRLPVCDSNKKVVGILTLGDIAQNRANLDDREVCITFEDICDCNTNKNAE